MGKSAVLRSADKSGALDGGPQCCMSNLRNGNVPCHLLCKIHVDFKMTL